jgi:K+-transporting ATPase A subunit
LSPLSWSSTWPKRRAIRVDRPRRQSRSRQYGGQGPAIRAGRAALFVNATTGTGTGAANAVLESMTPLSGLAALFNLLLGCISPGGVSTELYRLLLLAFIALCSSPP